MNIDAFAKLDPAQHPGAVLVCRFGPDGEAYEQWFTYLLNDQGVVGDTLTIEDTSPVCFGTLDEVLGTLSALGFDGHVTVHWDGDQDVDVEVADLMH